jgi:hypothetical protein
MVSLAQIAPSPQREEGGAEGVQGVTDIYDALPFPLEDLEKLGDLDPGTLGAPTQTRAEPIFKPSVRTSNNIVSISDRRKGG